MTTKNESSFSLITQVVDTWQNEMRKVLSKHGLTQAEFTMLSSTYFLSTKNKSTTQIEASTHAGIKPMNASILLRKLQTRKFLLRKEHPVDTRAKTVHLTSLGEETAIKLLAELDKTNTAFFQIPKNEEFKFKKKLLNLRNTIISN